MGMLLLMLQLLSRVSEICQPPWQLWGCVPPKCLQEVQLQVLEHRKSCRRVREALPQLQRGGLEQLCGEHWIRVGYHCTQLNLPARTKRILGAEITGVGRDPLDWAVGVPWKSFHHLLLKEAGNYAGCTLYTRCILYIIYVSL